MGELFSILPGCLLFLGLMAVMYFFWQRQQQKRDAQFEDVATGSGMAEADVAAVQQQLAQFPFGQRGGKTVVRTAVSTDNGTLLNLHQTRTAPASERDYYSAFLVRLDDGKKRPNLVLRVRTLLVDNVINRAIWGNPEEVALGAWPALADLYQCLGEPAKQTSALLQGGLADWLATEAAAGRVRNVELQNNILLVYQYERSVPEKAQLEGLLEAGKQAVTLI